MTTITQTYAKNTSSKTGLTLRERAGGPHSDQPETSNQIVEYFTSNTPFGSHMPLDTRMHWDWRNPLNIIPALVVLLFVLTVIGLLIQ
jgi:hypothetical protein